jgi:RND family efflux transporter MFP subunit
LKKKLVLFVLLMMIMIISSSCSAAQETGQEEESYIAVEVQTLQKGTIFVENSFSGKTFAEKNVHVMPTLMAEVLKVYVAVGDEVSKDDVLFLLDSENIQNQVDQAYLAYSSALTNFERTQEQIEAAQDSFERTKELYENGVVSKAQYDQAELAASGKGLEAASKGVDQARLAYNQALDALENAEVTAPIDGTVTAVNIIEGQMAVNSQPAVSIMDLDNISVEISVPENLINQLYKGQEARVEINSANWDQTAQITSISSSVNAMNNLYPLKISVANDETIKAGMFAKVTINTDIRENVFSVPGDAILNKNGKDVVFVEKDGLAIEKQVVTGLDTGRLIEIISGLEDGERVIVRGQNYISDGSKVKVVRGE